MNIKPTGLRIGNLLTSNQGSAILRVTAISQLDVFVDTNEDATIANYDELLPIPLTEDWLTSFGFTNYGSRNINEFECVDSDFCFGEDRLIEVEFVRRWYGTSMHSAEKHIRLSSNRECLYWVYIKYVHELQNAYYLFSNGAELAQKNSCLINTF